MNRLALFLVFIVFATVVLSYIVHSLYSWTRTCISPNRTVSDDWAPHVSRDPKNYIHPLKDTTIISGKEICENSTHPIISLVTSAPSNFAARAAIRETWASRKTSIVKVGFFLGLPDNNSIQPLIERESGLFKDIIQESFVDSYNNLTIKSIALLKWYVYSCPASLFLMKADDDSYVNIKNLADQYTSLYRPFPTVHGYLIRQAKPIRDECHRWHCPKHIYPDEYYPDYVTGISYIMSHDVARKLYIACLETPILHLEDVYITGVCAQKAGVNRESFPGFVHLLRSEKCESNYTTCHKVNPETMRSLWAAQNYGNVKEKT